jgi:hypothetical protein
MTRCTRTDLDHLNRILDVQHQVLTRDQAFASGLTGKAIEYRLRPGGPWQWLLPSVYLAVTGTVTQAQREVAAQLYAGPRGVITGPFAVRRHHLTCPGPDVIDVLVPWRVRRRSTGFVRIHRTRRMPRQHYRSGTVRFATQARAVADAAHFLTRFDDVRSVVSGALQRNACTLGELSAELAAGGLPRSALFRKALEEVEHGVRSVAEAEFRLLIQRSGLPEPVFNAQLFDASGRFIAMVDAWWQRAGVAAEVDSRAYHFTARDQDATTERHNRLLAAHDIRLLHFSPTRVRAQRAAVLAELGQAIEHGLQRPPLPITAYPVAA